MSERERILREMRMGLISRQTAMQRLAFSMFTLCTDDCSLELAERFVRDEVRHMDVMKPVTGAELVPFEQVGFSRHQSWS